MTTLLRQLVEQEDGYGPVAYAMVTGVFSVLVFRPELAAALLYRLADLLSLFVSQAEALF